jgi:hypothetical protein
MLHPAPITEPHKFLARTRPFWGALSGRDQNAVNKSVSGLLKLLHPNPEIEVPDDDLKWAVKLALEMRRPVEEQQKPIGSAEFRNTQFSYSMGFDGIEQFVSTPELQSEGSIRGDPLPPGSDPLPPGQVFAIGPGGHDEATSLYRIEVTEGPGAVSGFSLKPGLRHFARAFDSPSKICTRVRSDLVGDRDPREREIPVVIINSKRHSAYPINAHERRGKEVGLPTDKVEAMLSSLPTSFADERAQVVYEMAICLSNSRWVPKGLYDRAIKALGHVGITDVIILMGYYTSVSMTLAFYDAPAGATGMAR